MKIEKIEAIRMTLENVPEIYYVLPSGYKDKNIQVFESAYEELEVELVSSDKWSSEKKEMEIELG